MGTLDIVKRPKGEADNMNYSTTPRSELKDVNVGCADLRDRIKNLKSLQAHIFGHIHRPGIEFGKDGVTYVNASICNGQYAAVYAPAVINI